MLIDDDEVCLAMGREILESKYTLYPVPSGKQAFQILTKVIPDLILLDIGMSEMDGYAVLKKLKEGSATKNIPVIFLTSRVHPGDELDGLSLGAIDFVTKPFSPLLLIQRIENHLLICSQRKDLEESAKKQAAKTKNLQSAIASTLSWAIGARDKAAGSRAQRSRMYMEKMLGAMLKQGAGKGEAKSWDKEAFASAAQMHDIGNIFISEALLSKPGKLSAAEFAEVKKHPAHGLAIIDHMRRQLADSHPFLDYAAVFAETHHERWDGSGYPKGLKGADIPLAGRLMALVDAYGALVSARPHRPPMPPGDAAQEIIRGAGAAFDPALAEIFKAVSGEFAKIAEQQNP